MDSLVVESYFDSFGDRQVMGVNYDFFGTIAGKTVYNYGALDGSDESVLQHIDNYKREEPLDNEIATGRKPLGVNGFIDGDQDTLNGENWFDGINGDRLIYQWNNAVELAPNPPPDDTSPPLLSKTYYNYYTYSSTNPYQLVKTFKFSGSQGVIVVISLT